MQVYGDNRWVAQWKTDVFHQSVWIFEVQNIEPNKSSALTIVFSWCDAVVYWKCLMYNNLFWNIWLFLQEILLGKNRLGDNLVSAEKPYDDNCKG